MQRSSLLAILAAALGLGLAPVPARALDVYGFGSYWEPADADSGLWGGGVGVNLPFITEHLRLDGRIYFFEEGDNEKVDDKVNLTPVDLGAQIHFLPNGGVDPYLLGGISWVFVDTDRFDMDSGLGGYLGGGLSVSLGMTPFKFFGEALYRFSDLDTAFEEDFDADGFTGNVGLRLHF